MAANHILSFILLITTWAFFAFSQDPHPDNTSKIAATNRGVQSGLGDAMPCMQKLLPCKDYLTGPSAPPPTCCVPLKDVISSDTSCLCGVFTNPDFLIQLNVTQADALKLPERCGTTADVSVCKKGAASPAASAPGAQTPRTNNSSIDGSSPPAPSTKNEAGGISSHLSGYVCVLISSVILTITANIN